MSQTWSLNNDLDRHRKKLVKEKKIISEIKGIQESIDTIERTGK